MAKETERKRCMEEEWRSILASKQPSVPSRTDFPPRFIFGAATSAYQVEGAWNEGGIIFDESNGDIAADQYHRYKEDIDLIAKLGFGAYRFSISWSRIFPDGLGTKINEEGLTYYNNVINALLERGIQPFVTLYHWDLPLNLEESMGGWLNEQVVKYFAIYAETCFASFGDRVKNWITINEPLQTAVNGYVTGIFAPGRCEHALEEPYLASHHQLLAHAEAVSIYRNKYLEKATDIPPELVRAFANSQTSHFPIPSLFAHVPFSPHVSISWNYGKNTLLSSNRATKNFLLVDGCGVNTPQDIQKGQIGLVVDCEWAEALSDKIEDKKAAARRLDFQLGWYLDPIFYGDYPETMRERLGDRLPKFSEKNKELLRNSVDFLGLNHYTTRFIAHSTNTEDNYFYRTQEIERIAEWEDGEVIGEKAASPWLYVVPWGLRKLLNYVAQRYNNPPIYVAENGMDDEDNQSCPLHEMLDDKLRVRYYKEYLTAVAQAIKDGTDVRGYFAWSLLDNFEWKFGYTKRFGLIYVDYKNGLNRHLKSSAYWFLRFLKCGEDKNGKED
ncbi:hypothetical protein RHMOL_Rhmol05G0218600 [Rhododendron molle]|uniref:Uncharacterized protein n=1 Tax=Rhododendron molle TaxID=49168 RepID=A0ACC0NU25_RHOML|nr:hypothetical protein RHMOL_Rhmol05G0218600 [Rhododendron molle]